MSRIIFHIDVNSAYLSWTALELLKEDPDSRIYGQSLLSRRRPFHQTRDRTGQIPERKNAVSDPHRRADRFRAPQMSLPYHCSAQPHSLCCQEQGIDGFSENPYS